MSNVHNIDEARPHNTGMARCIDCGHEWIAVAPSEMKWLECPACALHRGRFLYAFERAGLHYFCRCGNDLFQVTLAGTYCPNRGVWQDFTTPPSVA